MLLTGTCWYELTGLWHLLSTQGHNVYRVPPGYPCARHGWDLIIVALSAEPVTGWGRQLVAENADGKHTACQQYEYRYGGQHSRKRKLTAVCSHQTRIGNLDAHLI